MTRHDLAQAVALSTSANWNQTEADWARLLSVASCFCIEQDGRVVSSVSVMEYGTDLAWIGMVLTLPEYRGKGLASALMTAAMDHCGGRGIGCIKLDATDAGAPVYRKFGFEDECVVERWRRSGTPLRAGLESGGTPDWDLDRAAFGADRRALLEAMPEVCCTGDGAFASRRPGRQAWQFGPCVAGSQESARTLAEWACCAADIYWDLFAGHAKAREVAHALRFAPARSLLRMSYKGRTIDQDPELVYALAGFEFG